MAKIQKDITAINRDLDQVIATYNQEHDKKINRSDLDGVDIEKFIHAHNRGYAEEFLNDCA